MGVFMRSNPHAVHTPVPAAHTVHAELVRAAQHRPPPHTPLEHSRCVSHVAPAALGVTHVPVADTTVPGPHPTEVPTHAPTYMPRALSYRLQEVQLATVPGTQHLYLWGT